MIRLWWLNLWGATGAPVGPVTAGGYPWVAHAYQRIWREQQSGSVNEHQLTRLAGEYDPRWDEIV